MKALKKTGAKKVKTSKIKSESVIDGAINDKKNSKVMSLNEACEYLDIARPTMYKYLSSGVISGFKYESSRVWRFEKAQLDTWIETQMKKGQS